MGSQGRAWQSVPAMGTPAYSQAPGQFYASAAPAPGYAAPGPAYGAVPEQYAVKRQFVKGGVGGKTNLGLICMTLFLPVVIFATVFGFTCFSVRYTNPALMYIAVIVAIGVVLFLGYLAYKAMKRRRDWGSAGDASLVGWFFLTFVVCTLALLMAIVFGDLNYWYNFQPYFDVNNLEYYPDVDPSAMHGQQLMDAGRVTFVDTAKLDMKKSMGFKNLDWYCVVPITNSNTSTTFDFWAVGINCCSGLSSDFQCGEFSNARAHGGLRLMRDDQRPFFRLAVQQAEAAYTVKAPHPVFFYWMQDPTSELNAYRDDGFKYYLLGILTYFAFSLFVTILGVIILSKASVGM